MAKAGKPYKHILYSISYKIYINIKMLFWQLAAELAVLLTLSVLLFRFLAQFNTRKTTFTPLFAALIIFTTGFTLRLSKNPDIIDIGFFLTEMGLLFTYLLFTSALILGQKKYWKLT